MTSEQALERVRRFEARNPAAVALARLISFAACAEPALIRRMRLEFLPGSNAGDEADLWFSSLVQSQSPGGIILFPEVAEILRRELGPELRARAWEETSRQHGNLRRAIRIEEELTWLGLDPFSNRVRIDELLGTVLSAMMGERPELANWAARALPRMPDSMKSIESASVLRIASELRLDRTPDWRATLGTLTHLPATLAALLSSRPRVNLGVRLSGGELTLGPVVPGLDHVAYSMLKFEPDRLGAKPGQTIEVPDTGTIPIEVSWTVEGKSRIAVVFAERNGTSQPLSTGAVRVELTTAAGLTWTLQPAPGTGSAKWATQALEVTVYTDGYLVWLHWRVLQRITGCLGFQVLCRSWSESPSGPAGSPVRVGPAILQDFSAVTRPATRGQWWIYRVVPVGGTPEAPQPIEALATPWSAPINVGPQQGSPISISFNATDAHAAAAGLDPGAVSDAVGNLRFAEAIAQPDNVLRNALGGDLLATLLSLLSQAKTNGSLVYAAMFELTDPEIIKSLELLGKQLYIILPSYPSGTARSKDINAEARRRLQASGASLRERTPARGGSAHNKFLVVCNRSGNPETVWTGNGSWTPGELFAGSNAAITVNNAELAGAYLEAWKVLANVKRGVRFSNQHSVSIGDATVKVWFTPRAGGEDVKQVRDYIMRARQGILFLVSEPGPTNSTLDTILDQSNLYVMGAASNGRTVTVFRSGREPRRISPKVMARIFGVSHPLGPMPAGYGLGSRIIVIDPFSPHPVVIIGSHPFGLRASERCEENFLTIENEPEIARRSAVYVRASCETYSVQAS